MVHGVIVNHLVRRAVSSTNSTDDWKDVMAKVPGWGIPVIVLTVLVLGFGLFCFDYILDQVIMTLAMVEAPSSAAAIVLPEESQGEYHDSTINKLTQPLLGANEAILFLEKPITSSLRGTFKHIRASGSAFRGIRHFFAYTILQSFIGGILPGPGIVWLPLVSMILALVHAAFTQAVVSSTATTFRQRFPSRAVWKHLLLPAAVQGVAQQATFILPGLLFYGLGLHHCAPKFPSADPHGKLDMRMMHPHGSPQPQPPFGIVALKGLLVVVVTVLLAFFVLLPATVALARVEASLLPPTDTTVVPVDTSFGGRAVSAGVPGDDELTVLRFADAWRSCGWQTRRRVVVLGFKIAILSLGLGIVFGLVFGGILAAVMKDAIVAALEILGRH